MHPMPLPQFLLLLGAVLLAAGVTLWALAQAGVPLALVALGLLAAAGLARLVARVE